eukprot:TRINITY_DN6442_c0_g1_i1.p1 TRINITY_DN6442_c0_g1~~TRINITY_DN6442_c0_g1_i1.p1  ORF type:complete len:200 (-),score=74.20 TRINITY_DN6442_c0_g1_i1:83-682(-)
MKSFAITLVLLLAVVSAAVAFHHGEADWKDVYQRHQESACPTFTYYSQCDSQWGSLQLGTSPTNSICRAGCAMTAVSMSLATFGATLGGPLVTPQTLNIWLKINDGYADDDLIVWDSVDYLGVTNFIEEITNLTSTQLGSYVSDCYSVIANVRNGTHWVLVTSPSDQEGVWNVNDPGFSTTSYAYDTMSKWVVYKPTGN